MKDWTGNSRSAHAALGARNYAQNEREEHDYYATEPKAARLLLDVETFSPVIWECACGEGHLAKEFEKAGHLVFASDLIDRGYGEKLDFLATGISPVPGADIINYIKKSLGWKSIRLKQDTWIDLCPECYEEHPELHFRRPTAAEDFAGVAEMRKENINE